MNHLSVCGLSIGIDTLQMSLESFASIRRYNKDLELFLFSSIPVYQKAFLHDLARLNVHYIDLQPILTANRLFATSQYSQYETSSFNYVTALKWLAIKNILSRCRTSHVLFVDADIEFYQPIPVSDFLSAFKHYRVIAQDEGTCVYPRKVCTGLLGFSNCFLNHKLLQSVYLYQLYLLAEGFEVHDQDVFNHIVANDQILHNSIYFLSNILFPTGLLAPMFKTYNPDECPIERTRMPIAFHANCVVGIANKRKLLNSLRP